MGTQDFGTQSIQWNYYDPLNSDEFDKHNQDVIPVGIYKGGTVTIVNDVRVEVNPLVCVISDGTQAARIQTSNVANIAISVATPYIILRWSWAPLTNWYMDIMSVALAGVYPDCVMPNDIVVGKGVFNFGGNLTSIDYGVATPAVSMQSFLKVTPSANTATPMKVHVSGGWISYGASRIAVAAQESATITAPAAGTARIDLIWIDSSGVVNVTAGTPATLPAVPAAPSHNGRIAVAEVYLLNSTAVITADLITDARPWINLAGSGILGGILSSFLTMGS